MNQSKPWEYDIENEKIFIYDGDKAEKLNDNSPIFIQIINIFTNQQQQGKFKMETISLINNEISSMGIYNFVGKLLVTQTTLKNLIFSNNLLDINGLQTLSSGIKICLVTYLDLSDNKINPNKDVNFHAAFYNLLGPPSSLTYLNLSGNKLTDLGGELIFKYLKENTKITNIQLKNTFLTSAITKNISKGNKKKKKACSIFIFHYHNLKKKSN